MFCCSCKDDNSLFQNKVFEIPIEDSKDADVFSYFLDVVEFIGTKLRKM